MAATLPATIAAVAVVLLVAYLQYRFAAVLVLRLSGAQPVGQGEEQKLRQTVENLCIGAGLPQPQLYIIESAAPNAFATGLDPQHASLAVTRGLMRLLDSRELEGVIAHELSHIGNYDTRLSAVAAAGVVLLRLPLSIVTGFYRLLFGLVRLNLLAGALILLSYGGLIFWVVPLSIVIAPSDPPENDAILLFVLLFYYWLLPYYGLVAPVLARFISGMVSRQRTLLADADAVLLTRYPDGLAWALGKMGAASGLHLRASGSTAHLYAVDPRPRDAPWWDRIFSSHPSVEERIDLLARMGSGIAPSVLQAAAEAGSEFARSHGLTVTPAPVRRESAPPTDEAEAPAEVSRASVAFRLTGPGAALHERPDTASKQVAQLASGSLITVLETEGDFLRVITGQDEFGYVVRSAPMTPVEAPIAASRPAEAPVREASFGEAGLPVGVDGSDGEGKEREVDYLKLAIVLLILVGVIILSVWAVEQLPCFNLLGGC
ncbi:MAG: M48 family metalloprotease [Chloroflexota bacterium]|nr:M48 family metalloprotease [Chloroflexota bacterium]